VHLRRRLFFLLAAAFPAPGAAAAQTAPAPHVETQSFYLTIPAPPHAAPAPTPGPVALPNRSVAQPSAGPLPRQLAYTGTDPLPLIAGGLAVVALSLLARRRARARLRGRAEA